MTKIKKYFSGKKILVVGGNGYLGSNLIGVLKNVKCKIFCLDRISGAKIGKNSTAEIKEVIDDIRNSDIWSQLLEGIDFIYYFAGQTSVYKSNENPNEDFEINVKPLFNLLETCRKQNFHPGILFSGTVTETGIPVALPVNELHPDNPVSVYDLHKLIAEYYLKYYSNREIVRGVTLRLANVYGP
ncbi:MAG: NAD(P)-dependent oxidoreductase, partial [Candidatus Taylorbacteria bacterium]